MKLNLLNYRIVNVVINGAIILFIVLLVVSALPFMMKSGTSIHSIGSAGYSISRSLKPIDSLPSDTLSHGKYMHFVDSVKQSRNMKNGVLSSWSVSAGFIGAVPLERCEECSIWDDSKLKVKEYFISLNWWTLDTVGAIDPTKYYVKGGEPYLRKVVCKPEPGKGNETFHCNEVDIPVPFRYDVSNKYMLIPVSEQIVKVLRVVLSCFTSLLILYFLYYIVGGFIKFLMEIARGTPFSDRNVRRLKRITLSFLLIPLAFFLLNLLMRIVFYRYFTADIKLSAAAWGVLWKAAVLSVIFAALYFAFKQGKKLKDEQDLTV